MSIFNRSAESAGKKDEPLKKEAPVSRSSSASEAHGEVSIVGRGVRIEGDIHVKGDVRVGGRINGAVFVEERIVVSQEGVILGGIQCGDADVAGNVEGDIKARGRLAIRKTGSILGEISAENLVVEDGARIDGRCRIGKPVRVQQEKETKTSSKSDKSAADVSAPRFLQTERATGSGA